VSLIRRIHADERGTTLMEAFVASVVTTAALAIAFAIIWGFLRHTQGQIALSEAESDSRVVLREMLIHFREAADPGSGALVVDLDWDGLTVFADVAPSDGVPDRVRYDLVDCDGQFCDLQVVVTPPVDPTAAVLSYDDDDALPARTLLEGVIASDAEPLFEGVDWNSAASSRTTVDTCGTCAVGAIAIDLRVQPLQTRANPGTLRIIEEVRLRNA
jgi:hypothetical protein